MEQTISGSNALDFTKHDVGSGFSVWEYWWLPLAIAGGLTVLALLGYLVFLPCMRRPDPVQQDDIEKGLAVPRCPMEGLLKSGEGISVGSSTTPYTSRETSVSRDFTSTNEHHHGHAYGRTRSVQEYAWPSTRLPFAAPRLSPRSFISPTRRNEAQGQTPPTMDPRTTYPLQIMNSSPQVPMNGLWTRWL